MLKHLTLIKWRMLPFSDRDWLFSVQDQRGLMADHEVGDSVMCCSVQLCSISRNLLFFFS